MYGIYANIWDILMVNVTIYGIHGSYGLLIIIIHYLVGGWATPLKNMSSSIGMIIPNIWENKIDVPNHQPVIHH